ncbi:maleylpyruvate isomerase family mycothiol-dependent enzyme [Cryobacterium sp. PH31-AA6]|uniref:maleylpyruvate isomerase family mycothiol-dependent enzyme n=1 Tax=Cryobacterium sp. PH31-AA6 TaxID=3046205 RepID=UPI0024BA51B6|nr:maleylpyruvate isomerase family mycothiol-dependent enzyme [Cryobacterium sp. PH31-AA6]MDJ0323090.1 maleylpyruvate isomerase family mycothiol-dependent enzyme [Cryobacterium sp. PH31-AA6]
MTAPDDLMGSVRLGTEFFRRHLDTFLDAALAGESLLPGWTRAHVVAHVAYNARAIGRLAQWAATGVETPMYASVDVRNAEITEGVLLASDALVRLFDDSAASLDRHWRELPDESWTFPVRNGQGRMVPLGDTVWMRTREVWIHAVDLNDGSSFEDIPVPVLERILGDIAGAWQGRDEPGIRLSLTGPRVVELGPADAAVHVKGSLAALTNWAAGRGSAGVTLGTGTGIVPAAPRWL